MIAVIDYGIGNLRSAEKALAHLGADARLVRDPGEVAGASGVVLPGVGAYGACMEALRTSGFEQVLVDTVAAGTPFLGLCVGFQMLFSASEESPDTQGLGILPGIVRRLPDTVKLPQMQWNTVRQIRPRSSAMWAGLPTTPWFYFVHTYAPLLAEVDESDIAMVGEYGEQFVAAIERERLWGTQFHPEKSGAIGLSLLANFVDLCASLENPS